MKYLKVSSLNDFKFDILRNEISISRNNKLI